MASPGADRGGIWPVRIPDYLGGSSERTALRPVLLAAGMCEAQRVDLEAALAGEITWAQYFARWGDGSYQRVPV
jgi:hypothetical protein